MNRVLMVLLGVIAISVFACRSSEDTASKDNEMTEMKKPSEPGPGVPPGQCRIVGVIVSINPILSAEGNDPCSKAPCLARVRVNEVEGYGMGFDYRIGNREIDIKFVGTLGELRIGSRFRANVQKGATSIDNANKDPEFRIANFTVL